jgi:diguanylate cyclase (GGDEF)-like protein/PAS domain S-box-containing protein
MSYFRSGAISDESARLAALHSLQLLDTAGEEVFDRVTRLATKLLRVKISLFSLIDEDRQWFKSCVGLSVKQTARDIAFCSHAISEQTALVVGDATLDARFATNPLVIGDPGIRFYAGIPIRSRAGHAIGTFCAIDLQPRELSGDDFQTLQDLAAIVSDEVNRREELLSAQMDLHSAGKALREGEERLRSVFDLASVGIALITPDGRWSAVNATTCHILGYSETELLETSFQKVTHPDDLAIDLEQIRLLSAGAIRHYDQQKRYVRRDGSVIWVHLNVSVKRAIDGKPEYFISALTDIQAQKTAEASLAALYAEVEQRVTSRTAELVQANDELIRANERQRLADKALRVREAELSNVLEFANDVYIGLDITGRVTAWNRQAELTFQWTALEAVGAQVHTLIIPPELQEQHQRGMAKFLSTGEGPVLGKRLELPSIRKDRSSLTVEIRIHAVDVEGQLAFSAFLHDISERKRSEAERDHAIRHDSLTGLLNRRALNELLPKAQARSKRHGIGFALLFIDLDGFKAVNDRLGHEAGDQVLVTVAQRLRETVRQNDAIVRLAGDEFTVVLEGGGCRLVDAQQVARKLIEAISLPVDIDGVIAQVGASVGIAIQSPGQQGSAEELIREADKQMYSAKQAGRGCVRPV